jgi:hypothetical protein
MKRIRPGSAVQWVAPQSFKTVINANEKLLEVRGGATNRDLVIVANATPEDTNIDSAYLLVIDGNGKVVDTLRVIVSPLRPQPEEDISLFPSTSRPHESQLAPHPSEYVRRNPQSDPLRQGCKPRCGAGSPEIR